jgi:hypothetical protein
MHEAEGEPRWRRKSPLLTGAALVVEADDILGGLRHVGDDEAESAAVCCRPCHSRIHLVNIDLSKTRAAT